MATNNEQYTQVQKQVENQLGTTPTGTAQQEYKGGTGVDQAAAKATLQNKQAQSNNAANYNQVAGQLGAAPNSSQQAHTGGTGVDQATAKATLQSRQTQSSGGQNYNQVAGQLGAAPSANQQAHTGGAGVDQTTAKATLQSKQGVGSSQTGSATTGAAPGGKPGSTAGDSGTTGTATPGIPGTTGSSLSQNVTITSPEIDPLEHLDTSQMEGQLAQMHEAATQQQTAAIDRATEQGITELQRAEEDAQEMFQTQRNQIDIDEAKALDNQALYAEARGDKGGIGQSQYGQIQNAAATNRLTVNKTQTKLATDTARQIADLRAQGEYEKADAVLALTQNYLSQLFQLGQWSAEYNLSIDQFNTSLNQWAAEYEMGMAELGMAQDQWAWQMQQAENDTLSAAGWAILEAGIVPSESQLAAMGMTSEQATDYLNELKLGGRGGGVSGLDTTDSADPGSSGFSVYDDAEALNYQYGTLSALVYDAHKDNPNLTRAEAHELLQPYVNEGYLTQAGRENILDKYDL